MDRRVFVLAGWILVVFAVVGVGLGLTGYVTTDFASGALHTGDTGAVGQAVTQVFAIFLVFQGTFVVFFVGPLVALVAGLVVGSVLWEPTDALAAGGLGSFFGFYLLVFTAVPLMLVAAGGSGGAGGDQSLRIGQLVVPVLVSALPTGIVGGVSAVIGNQMQ